MGSNRKWVTVVHAAFKAFADYNSMEQVALRRGQRLRDVNKLVEERYAEDLWKNWPDGMQKVAEVREGKGRRRKTQFFGWAEAQTPIQKVEKIQTTQKVWSIDTSTL